MDERNNDENKLMGNDLVAITVIIIILIGFIFLFYIPFTSQHMIYDYNFNGSLVDTKYSYVIDVKCPIGGHRDGLHPVRDNVEQLKLDWHVLGMRIDLISPYYCEKHHIEFGIV